MHAHKLPTPLQYVPFWKAFREISILQIYLKKYAIALTFTSVKTQGYLFQLIKML